MKKIFALLVFVMATVACHGQNAVIEITGEEAELPLAQGFPVVVDCSAVWCGPCKMYAPVYEAAAKKYEGVARFYHVDVDDCVMISYTYQIEALPTTMIFDAEGKLLFRDANAYTAEELDAILRQYLPAK